MYKFTSESRNVNLLRSKYDMGITWDVMSQNTEKRNGGGVKYDGACDKYTKTITESLTKMTTFQKTTFRKTPTLQTKFLETGL